jgi:hypothetical protein
VNITGLIRTCVVQIHSTSLWAGGRTFQVSCNFEHLVQVKKVLHTILYFGLTTAWGFKCPGMWYVTRWKVPDVLENHSGFTSWVQHIFLELVIPRIPFGLRQPEDEGTMILQNTGRCSPNTTRHHIPQHWNFHDTAAATSNLGLYVLYTVQPFILHWPWRLLFLWWRQQVPLKCWYTSIRLHSNTSKHTSFTVTADKTSNFTLSHPSSYS